MNKKTNIESHNDEIVGFCTVKSISVSPQKINLVLDSVRGRKVTDAISTLLFHPKRSAFVVLNAVKNAVSMAKQKKGLFESDLQIHSIYSGLQRIIKQVIPHARGKRGVRKRRSSHIFVGLKKLEPQVKKIKKEVSNGK